MVHELKRDLKKEKEHMVNAKKVGLGYIYLRNYLSLLPKKIESEGASSCF